VVAAAGVPGTVVAGRSGSGEPLTAPPDAGESVADGLLGEGRGVFDVSLSLPFSTAGVPEVPDVPEASDAGNTTSEHE
jgi:hypothetical protein